jgi:dipeptide/tripeptide permease
MHKNHSNMSDMRDDHNRHYPHLLMMAILSFIAMYILMYAMVNTIGNVYNNLNEFYMAGLMTAPMVLIELFIMRAMYQDKKRNALIIAMSIVAGLAFFFLIRQQGAVSDKQFLRSMIPHHASAILMCEKATIQDPEIKELCKSIIASQQAEIDQMKAKLSQLDK